MLRIPSTANKHFLKKDNPSIFIIKLSESDYMDVRYNLSQMKMGNLHIKLTSNIST